MIWTAGVRPSHLGSKLAEVTGCVLDKAGHVLVQHEFSIPENPEIRVAGDLSDYSHTINDKPIPDMAAPAKQAETFIGKDIAAIIANRARPTFSYFDFGSIAVLKHASAVADLQGLRFSGGVGWLLWAFVHMVLIPDWEQDHAFREMDLRPADPAARCDSSHRHAEPAHGTGCSGRPFPDEGR